MLFLLIIISMMAVKQQKYFPYPSSFLLSSPALIPSPKALKNLTGNMCSTYFLDKLLRSCYVIVIPCNPLDESDIGSCPLYIL